LSLRGAQRRSNLVAAAQIISSPRRRHSPVDEIASLRSQ
jgi:hypothetical protein